MRAVRTVDDLGSLIPPGALDAATVERDLRGIIDGHRFSAGLGVPSMPTRYVVSMNPADRAWFDPRTEDDIARALTRYAETTRALFVGDVEVELESDPDLAPGRPRYWCGYAEDDLLVLAAPSAAAEVFAASP